jgi:hypothetical protein
MKGWSFGIWSGPPLDTPVLAIVATEDDALAALEAMRARVPKRQLRIFKVRSAGISGGMIIDPSWTENGGGKR